MMVKIFGVFLILVYLIMEFKVLDDYLDDKRTGKNTFKASIILILICIFGILLLSLLL